MEDRRIAITILVCVIIIGIGFAVVSSMKARAMPFLEFVSGTEYNIGESGQVIVEARYANGSTALISPCLITVWYPDKLVLFSQNASLESNGNQYVNFTVPNVTGVFEYQAECSVGTISKSFHVSEFQNETTEKLLRRIKAVMPK